MGGDDQLAGPVHHGEAFGAVGRRRHAQVRCGQLPRPDGSVGRGAREARHGVGAAADGGELVAGAEVVADPQQVAGVEGPEAGRQGQGLRRADDHVGEGAVLAQIAVDGSPQPQVEKVGEVPEDEPTGPQPAAVEGPLSYERLLGPVRHGPRRGAAFDLAKKRAIVVPPSVGPWSARSLRASLGVLHGTSPAVRPPPPERRPWRARHCWVPSAAGGAVPAPRPRSGPVWAARGSGRRL